MLSDGFADEGAHPEVRRYKALSVSVWPPSLSISPALSAVLTLPTLKYLQIFGLSQSLCSVTVILYYRHAVLCRLQTMVAMLRKVMPAFWEISRTGTIVGQILARKFRVYPTLKPGTAPALKTQAEFYFPG